MYNTNTQVLAFAGVRAGHEGLQRHVVELQDRIATLEATMYVLLKHTIRRTS